MRIEASSEDEDVLVTAFDDGGKTVLVVVNKSAEAKKATVPADKNMLVAVTDKDNNLSEKTVDSGEVILTPRSVTTLVW